MWEYIFTISNSFFTEFPIDFQKLLEIVLSATKPGLKSQASDCERMPQDRRAKGPKGLSASCYLELWAASDYESDCTSMYCTLANMQKTMEISTIFHGKLTINDNFQ